MKELPLHFNLFTLLHSQTRRYYIFQTYYDIYKLSDLAVIPDEEVLVLVVDDLDELVSDAAEPEEGGEVVEVGQLVVEVRHRVVAHAQVGADAVSPE